ncbi:response regulator transcription factor [Dyadobacter chenwenxiniae]|uniref:Response regulator transcription factor n=1 Tax=Dyadobacter chenwenxiniae TaxID=2906456 RepID=A0A9X1TEE4_9BACT|nr:response regulator transcription factor [Dyadobacter chenwenxiniae]MCF0052954.1 response regulator transcription factor [Dyadobacter chenwenxiniae]MCF0061435.1 response regulator transcription factor [Dyadobacter chenwenxiniae]UON81257.1 response regulator transcription factor [Dyadobacter chenwenxiniae]
MKIKAILVDDEPHAIEVLDNYLRNFSEIEIVARCQDAIQAFQVLQQQKVDLMFLDVKMPGLTGTELLRSLKTPPKVVFTTAYQDYAVEGFDLNAVDYLLKPIPFERFLRAMDKVFTGLNVTNQSVSVAQRAAVSNQEVFLYLKVDRKMVKVNVNDILWVESLRDYIKVVLKDKVLITKQKISLLEELLPEDSFIRVHRSFIVSVDKVESYHAHKIEIAGKELPIGRNFRNDCQRRFKLTF